MSDRTRRALLGAVAAGGATALSGCFGFGPGVGGSCTSRYYLELERVDDSSLREAALSDAPHDHPEQWTELLETAAAEGEATLRTIYGSPVRSDQLVEVGGAYHRTSVEVTDTESVEAHVLELEYDEEVSAPADATVVAYADLPAVDQGAYDTMTRGTRGERFADARSVSMGGFEYVYPDGTESDSRFVADSSVWVRDGDVEVEIRVTGTEQTERETFSITLERVADSADGFVEYVRENHVADLSGLSDAEADVLRTATGAEYDECEPLSEEFQGVVDRLRGLPDTYRPDGSLLVEFEGETYDADLLNAVV
jgi:hypothetical protein